MPFTVTVRDHMMVAHSFTGEAFGPAQRLHGATFIVDATFGADELDADGVVVDIGRAAAALSEITGSLTYRNLDDEPDVRRDEHDDGTPLPGHRRPSRRARRRRTARRGSRLTSITVTLHESHIAWASYARSL